MLLGRRPLPLLPEASACDRYTAAAKRFVWQNQTNLSAAVLATAGYYFGGILGALTTLGGRAIAADYFRGHLHGYRGNTTLRGIIGGLAALSFYKVSTSFLNGESSLPK